MTSEQEAYNWILVAIDSSTNDFHFAGIDRLIDLFQQMYPKEEKLHLMLKDTRGMHWNHLHAILT